MGKKKLNFILFLCKKCKILSNSKYIPSFIVKMSINTCKMQIRFIQKYQKQRYNKDSKSKDI